MFFSKPVDKDSVDIAKISLFIGAIRLALDTQDSILTSEKDDRILEIQLSTDKANQLTGITDDLSVNFTSGAFAEDIVMTENARALFGLTGIECTIADFVYIDSVQHPIHVDVLENENWIIGNSSISSIEEMQEVVVESDAPGIVEFDPDDPTTIIFSYNNITFSDFSLGSVIERSDTRLAAAGVFQTNSPITSVPDTEEATTVEKKVFLEHKDGDDLVDAFSVELASEDGSFGIKRNDTNESVSANETPVSNPSTGVYEFTFDAKIGVSYTVSWRIVSTAGADPIFQVDTIEAPMATALPVNIQAITALSLYRGVVVILDRSSSDTVFNYMSPDGLYPSDIVFDNDGNFVVAESNFDGTGGRVIKLDALGNIVFEVGNGRFGPVYDAKARSNGNLVVSV